jgi:hypothetical protein
MITRQHNETLIKSIIDGSNEAEESTQAILYSAKSFNGFPIPTCIEAAYAWPTIGCPRDYK